MVRLIAGFSAALIWTALAVAPASAADKVVLMLNWYVYGEHAPFYYGKAKGIYAAENIDLEIQEGRGSAATTQNSTTPSSARITSAANIVGKSNVPIERCST